MASRTKWLLAACFFISGATSLVLEVAWSKQLSYLLGNTLYAIATVIAAFMGGLGLGSVLAGFFGWRLNRPIRAYAWLQFAIAACGLLSVPVFRSTGPLFRLLYVSFEPSGGTFLLARFAVVFLLMAVPTTLMGMTLPILVGAFSRRKSVYDMEAGLLYGINTLGAVAGTLTAGFILVQNLGLLRTCLVAGIADLLVGLAALWLDRSTGKQNRAGEAEHPGRAPAQSGTTRWTARQWTIAAIFGMSGVIALTYEVAWFRLLSLTMGPSVYAFSAMLGVFLIGIGAGSTLAAPFIGRSRLGGVGVMALLEVVLALVGLGALLYTNQLPEWNYRLSLWAMQRFGEPGFPLAQLVIAMAIVILPCLVMGALFPAAVRAIRESGAADVPETNVGRLYAFNTAGSIVGSLAAGFWLLPVLGVWTTILWSGLGSVALGIGLALMTHTLRPAVRLAAAGTAAAATLGLAVAAPAWDVSLFNLGLYRWAFAGMDLDLNQAEDVRMVYYREGINAPVAVFSEQGAGSLRVSGKADASTSTLDLFTQHFMGSMPVLLSPSPRKAALIGYGSGMSAGALLAFSQIERLDVVELERGVLEASPYFESVNGSPLEDPRVNLIVEDGRIYLSSSDETYDIITSAPSNPWMAGTANLFTKDYYHLVRSRMAPRGIFAQWIQAYDISETAFSVILASLREAFPHVVICRPNNDDVIVLASPEPLSMPWLKIVERFGQERVRESFRRIDIQYPEQLCFFFQGSTELVDTLVSGAPVRATDDNVWLEYRMPREILYINRPENEDLQLRLTRLGVRTRIRDLRRLLPGLPIEDVVRAIVVYPHMAEPMDVPGLMNSDPWFGIRQILVAELPEELRALGEDEFAESVTDWEARGDRYRRLRISATQMLSQARESGRPTEQQLAQVLETVRDHPLALVLEAERLLEGGDLDGAEALYSQVAERPFFTLAYNALIGLARVAEARGDLDGALVRCREAIALNPYLSEAYLEAARLEQKHGNREGAIAVLHEALRYAPQDERIGLLLARLEPAGAARG